MTEAIKTLTYAVRVRVVAKYLGQLGVMLAVLTLVPLGASLMSGEYVFTRRYLAVALALLVIAAPTLRLPTPAQIQVNEALTIAALAFAISPLLMAYPMMAAGLPVVDAMFESVSAVTTTGLTTLASVEDRPTAFLFGRAWIQWYGGLGIVILSVALLMGHHMAARRLIEPVSGENLITTARTYARRMLYVYVVLTMLGIGVTWIIVGDGFTALTHILTAVSTAGFSTFDNNLAGVDQWSGRFVIIAFAFSGAVPFVVYYRIYQHGWYEAVRDLELRALLVAVVVISVLISLFIYKNAGLPLDETVAHAVLLGASAQTSTGFSSLNAGELDTASKVVLIASMCIGGGAGSTAGGVKMLRLLILLRLAQVVIQRTAMPSHAVFERRLAGKPLQDDEVIRALLLVVLFAIVVFISWLVFVAFGHAPLDALFDVVSATGTVGLSTGVTGPELHPLLKVILCVDMLFGRLEIVAVLVVLYPGTWFGKRAAAV